MRSDWTKHCGGTAVDRNTVSAPSPFDDGDRLGAGRSGTVYVRSTPDGALTAVKVFGGDPLANLVHWVTSGAPNPYIWDPDALQCAVLRRRILDGLLRVWFDDRVRVARPRGHGWNLEARAQEMGAELVRGRAPTLHHPFSALREGEMPELLREVMRPLQRHLVESGFDGLVWQAGRGNPVAANNFLRTDDGTWVWIDLESGVPALFPLDPSALIGVYLPMAVRYRRAPFDDVDVRRLAAYIGTHRRHLTRALGRRRVISILHDVRRLARSQSRWKNSPRLHRSIAYCVRRGDLSAREAKWYRDHPIRWLGRETARGVFSLRTSGARLLGRVAARLAAISPMTVVRGALRDTWRYLTSQRFRAEIARRYVIRRIDCWSDRRQLRADESDRLRTLATAEDEASHLTDFGFHLAIKPAVKLFAWVLVPTAAQAGWADPLWVPVVLLIAGAAARTLYTLGRVASRLALRKPAPWIALAFGALPVVGNAAYPVQVAVSSGGRRSALAAFILYDTFARIGEQAPIWGGRDTLTEHVLNRIPDLLVTRRDPLIEERAPAHGRRPRAREERDRLAAA